MKRYLIVGFYNDETYFIDELTKNDLLLAKDHLIEAIIDTESWKMYDPNINEWVEIKQK